MYGFVLHERLLVERRLTGVSASRGAIPQALYSQPALHYKPPEPQYGSCANINTTKQNKRRLSVSQHVSSSTEIQDPRNQLRGPNVFKKLE